MSWIKNWFRRHHRKSLNETKKEQGRPPFFFNKDLIKECEERMVAREYKLSNGITLREMDPSVFWYSMRQGSKEQPIITGGIKGIIEIKAELPSVEATNIEVNCTGKTLTISAYTKRGRYYKELELPIEVYPKVFDTRVWEGKLEIILAKPKPPKP